MIIGDKNNESTRRESPKSFRALSCFRDCPPRFRLEASGHRSTGLQNNRSTDQIEKDDMQTRSETRETLIKRMAVFTVHLAKMLENLPSCISKKNLQDQLSRSGSSIGARNSPRCNHGTVPTRIADRKDRNAPALACDRSASLTTIV